MTEAFQNCLHGSLGPSGGPGRDHGPAHTRCYCECCVQGEGPRPLMWKEPRVQPASPSCSHTTPAQGCPPSRREAATPLPLPHKARMEAPGCCYPPGCSPPSSWGGEWREPENPRKTSPLPELKPHHTQDKTESPPAPPDLTTLLAHRGPVLQLLQVICTCCALCLSVRTPRASSDALPKAAPPPPWSQPAPSAF